MMLNRFLGQALGRLRLQVEGDGCSWMFTDEGDELDRMLWPVAWSAASLLTSDDLRLVRRCAADRCGWLFLDHSRNRSRRCLLYTSPSPRDRQKSRMPSSA